MKKRKKKEKKKRGFAAMPRERHLELAAKGGKTAWSNGTAHRWTSEEASAAGRKGGAAHDLEFLRRIGEKGRQRIKEKRLALAKERADEAGR